MQRYKYISLSPLVLDFIRQRGSFPSSLSQMLHHVIVCLAFFAEVSHSNTACTNNFPRQPIIVNLAKTGPFTKLFVVRDINERNVLLQAKALHEFLVCWLIARLGQEDNLSL